MLSCHGMRRLAQSLSSRNRVGEAQSPAAGPAAYGRAETPLVGGRQLREGALQGQPGLRDAARDGIGYRMCGNCIRNRIRYSDSAFYDIVCLTYDIVCLHYDIVCIRYRIGHVHAICHTISYVCTTISYVDIRFRMSTYNIVGYQESRWGNGHWGSITNYSNDC